MEGSNNLAYGLMMYHSAMVEMDALSRQQRDVKMPRKEEQQGERGGKVVEGDSLTQNIRNKFPNDNQKGKVFNYTMENGKINIRDGIQEVDFVIDMDGNLHIGRGHSYLASGNSVQAAGKMKVNSQGYIRNIINDSGYYQPTVNEALNYPNIFRNIGLNVDSAWIRIDEFNSSLSNYVIDSKVFYNGPIQNMP